MSQSELEANTCHRRQTRASKSRLVWVLLLIGGESGAKFFNQSQSEVKQNQSKTRITFNTQMKTALMVTSNFFHPVQCNRGYSKTLIISTEQQCFSRGLLFELNSRTKFFTACFRKNLLICKSYKDVWHSVFGFYECKKSCEQKKAVNLSESDCWKWNLKEVGLSVFDATTRQRTVRQETTMSKHGTLPDFVLYQRQLIVGERVTLNFWFDENEDVKMAVNLTKTMKTTSSMKATVKRWISV